MAWLMRMTLTLADKDGGEGKYTHDYPSHSVCKEVVQLTAQAQRILFNLTSAEGWSVTVTAPDGSAYRYEAGAVCGVCQDSECKPDTGFSAERREA